MNVGYDLDWELYPNMFVMNTIGDGSCFFHCIAYAMFENYKVGSTKERISIVRQFRDELSDKLSELSKPFGNYPDLTSENIIYDTLSRGKLREFSEVLPEYSLDSMKKILLSDCPVDNIFNELISNELNIDIYILNNNTKNVYITGNDADILYKNRRSVVILYTTEHYSLVGIKLNDKTLKSFFEPDHPFILQIKNSMRKKGVDIN